MREEGGGGRGGSTVGEKKYIRDNGIENFYI